MQAASDSDSFNVRGAAGDAGAGTARASPRRAEQWERRREQVAAFWQQHGRIPRHSDSKGEPLTEEERQLGAWCHRQRQRKAGTAVPPLTPEQEAALEATSGWFWDGKEVSQACIVYMHPVTGELL